MMSVFFTHNEMISAEMKVTAAGQELICVCVRLQNKSAVLRERAAV